MKKEDIYNLLYSRRNKVRCSECGKEIGVPNVYNEKERSKLSPYCCAASIFIVQWLIHHGWHVRNLGISDSHPYYCDDCWVVGTPEYSRTEYGDSWCSQVEDVLGYKEEIE